jgi:hypothetical protein
LRDAEKRRILPARFWNPRELFQQLRPDAWNKAGLIYFHIFLIAEKMTQNMQLQRGASWPRGGHSGKQAFPYESVRTEKQAHAANKAR